MPPSPYLSFPSSRNFTPQAEPGKFPPPPKGLGRTAQWSRLEPQLKALQEALDKRDIAISGSAPGIAAEDVLVFELTCTHQNFLEAVRNTAGMEWLAEFEEEFDPGTEGFYFFSKDKGTGEKVRDEKKSLNGMLYMVASNSAALQQIQSAWKAKQQGKGLSGDLSKFGQVLDHVLNVRLWNWQDRLGEIGIEDWRDEIEIGQEEIRFEAELWFRSSNETRRRERDAFCEAVKSEGGEVSSPFEHEGCGYHGVIVKLPASAVRQLVENPATSKILLAESVYHFWTVGQAMARPIDDDREMLPERLFDSSKPAPSELIEVAVLDGMPVANHQTLEDRIEVDDPDEYQVDYPSDARIHGTSMASLVIHGDLVNQEEPLNSTIYIRPIMKAEWNAFSQVWEERIPSNIYTLDLIERCVRRIKVGDGDLGPVAPDVKVINLSIGDEGRVFAGLPSALARMLDWLQHQYNILFIISAGNIYQHWFDLSLHEFESLDAEGQEKALLESRMNCENRGNRILSPAESINGITVGAGHWDQVEEINLPAAQKIVTRHPDLSSPSSRMGPGFRKGMKPDILMSGGRQPQSFRDSGGRMVATAYTGPKQPGLLTAIPSGVDKLAYTRGTSVATALATRKCAKLFEHLREVDGERTLTDDYLPVLAKALMVHSASWQHADDHLRDLFGEPGRGRHPQWKSGSVSPLVGYGRAAEDDFVLSDDHRATVLGWDEINSGQVVEFDLPLPKSMSGQRGKRRFTVTLAWFSPINPTDRRYRQAKLAIKLPETVESTLGAKRKDTDHNQVKRGTVIHSVFEGQAVRGFTEDNYTIQILCQADAGDKVENIRFGLAVTVEGAEEVFTSILQDVRQGLRVPVDVST